MRRFNLNVLLPNTYRHPQNPVFETCARDFSGHNRPDSDRSRLIPLLEMHELKLLTVSIRSASSHSYAFELRGISPIIKMLKEKGVVVKISVQRGSLEIISKRDNISKLFDGFSPEEVKKMVQEEGIDFRRYERECRKLDGVIPWIGTLPPNSGTGLQWKKHLYEHYEIFRDRELEEKIRLIRKAKWNLDVITVALQ